MQTIRTIIGGGAVGLLLLIVLAACGTAEQVATAPLVPASGIPTAGQTPTPTTNGGSGSTASPILTRPTGTVELPIVGGQPTITPGASAVAPGSDGSCPTTHPIKGVQLGPVKTYFVSDSSGYANARASECFATEANAEAAGYRKTGR